MENNHRMWHSPSRCSCDLCLRIHVYHECAASGRRAYAGYYHFLYCHTCLSCDTWFPVEIASSYHQIHHETALIEDKEVTYTLPGKE